MVDASGVRLVICVHPPGELARSFPPSVTGNVDTITIRPIRERKDELPVILDRWFVERTPAATWPRYSGSTVRDRVRA